MVADDGAVEVVWWAPLGSSPATIERDREERFLDYVARSENYNRAIIEAGDQPWHGGDLAKRRQLWSRRFRKPHPPEGLFTEYEDISGKAKRWE